LRDNFIVVSGGQHIQFTHIRQQVRFVETIDIHVQVARAKIEPAAEIQLSWILEIIERIFIHNEEQCFLPFECI